MKTNFLISVAKETQRNKTYFFFSIPYFSKIEIEKKRCAVKSVILFASLSLLRTKKKMTSFILSALVTLVIVTLFSFVVFLDASAAEHHHQRRHQSLPHASASACTLIFRNTLAFDSVRLCGRKNGGVPGAWYSKLLAPNQTFTRPCSVTTEGVSYETYFTVRNSSTNCGWNNPCTPNTGTCLEYPWTMGEGLSSQDQYWYGSLSQNWDGGIGFTKFAFDSPEVNYGVKLSCLSYGTSSWNSTCLPSSSAPAGAACDPSHPVLGKFADTGVVACGPKSAATMYITIFEKQQ